MSSDWSATRMRAPARDEPAPPMRQALRGTSEVGNPWRPTLVRSVSAMPAAALAGMAVSAGSCTLAAAAALLAVGWAVDNARDGGDRPDRWRVAHGLRLPAVATVSGAIFATWALGCLAVTSPSPGRLLPMAGVALVAAGAAMSMWRDVAGTHGPPHDPAPPSAWPWPLAGWVASVAAVVAASLQRAQLLPAAPALLTLILALLLWRVAHASQRELSHRSEHA